MDVPTTLPAALRPGDTVGIVAPAGPVHPPDAIRPALALIESWGFRVRFDNRIFEASRYLAGSDEARASELMRYVEDPSINAILALRGGFGCSRLIPLLDQSRIRRNCKIFMGFSDLTTLHLYFLRLCDWATVHGPVATTLTRDRMSPQAERHLLRLWTDPQYLPALAFPQLETWVPGRAEGVIAGGCLSIIAASLGTVYEIETEGKILFLEEMGEAPYRIDRLITQLRLAGKLEGLAGILVGSLCGCEPDEGDYTAAEVLRELLSPIGVPVLAGFPTGHGMENWALPLGRRVRMDADTREVLYLEPFTSVPGR
ncbi:MAG: LD-carboxypeptidase [Acidobacteria bacterium]|nr:LD-carboxypeptidase [Acidobacteriota bacterium]